VVCQVHAAAGDREHTEHDICGCALFQRVGRFSIISTRSADSSLWTRPGHGQVDPKHQGSIEYNRNIALQTVRWAMVDWLKDDHRGGLWEVRPSH
jgi:hypothetical protein